MSNLTLVTNGADYAACYHSLPGGDWTNSIVHGVSDAGIEIQHYLSCDGFNAIMPSQYGILTLRNWRVSGVDGVIPGRYNGNYGAQEELSGWLVDSGTWCWRCSKTEISHSKVASLSMGWIRGPLRAKRSRHTTWRWTTGSR